MAEIIPNADAGKAMKSSMGNAVIDIDGDELRDLAEKLQAHADNMRPLLSASTQIGETAVSEAQQFTTDGKPAPVYANTVAGLSNVSTQFSGEITKVIEQLESDASGLVWIANANDETQDEAAKKTATIDASLIGASPESPSDDSGKKRWPDQRDGESMEDYKDRKRTEAIVDAGAHLMDESYASMPAAHLMDESYASMPASGFINFENPPPSTVTEEQLRNWEPPAMLPGESLGQYGQRMRQTLEPWELEIMDSIYSRGPAPATDGGY